MRVVIMFVGFELGLVLKLCRTVAGDLNPVSMTPFSYWSLKIK